MTDYTNLVSDTIQNLLTHLGFGDNVQTEVEYDSAQDLYQILLRTDNPALLIGFHGETLSSLQLFLGQHLHKTVDQWLNLSINVNDYRERRESSIHSLVDTAVQQVLTTGIPHSLPPLPAYERRLVHLKLADHPQVSTASQGVGRSRSVIISPK